MKHLMLVCLLAMSATTVAVAAETAITDVTEADKARQDAEQAKARAKQDAEDAKTRAKLEEARARLDKAAQEVAELSQQLGRGAMNDERIRTIMFEGDRRAVLGVQIDNAPNKAGARVMRVSPGGAAEEAGLRDGDVIVSVDGKSLAGSNSAGQALVEQMRTVKADQKVKVRVLRDGKNKDFTVTARAMPHRVVTMRGHGPEMIGPGGGMAAIGPMGHTGPMPIIREFRSFMPGGFGGMELASLTPKLGAYFGATEGVLVVQAPKDAAFKLEDGDVIQSIDGRKPDDGAHAMRILRSYSTGEKVSLNVLRQRKSLTLAVTMPEQPNFGADHLFNVPMPAMPAIPAEPPMPAVPGGAGTFE